LFQFVDGKIAARRVEVLCNGVCDAAVLTFFAMQHPDAATAVLELRHRIGDS
jgi:hypothetical protein